jgi:nucleoid DNA-binding protein
MAFLQSIEDDSSNELIVCKRQLIDLIAKKARVTLKEADHVLTAFIEVVMESVANGEQVSVSNFGVFEPRMDRGKVKPKFEVSKFFREKVKEATSSNPPVKKKSIKQKQNILEKVDSPIPKPTAPRPQDPKVKKDIDYPLKDSQNKELGLKGEKLVFEYEKNKLCSINRQDLAQKVFHASVEEGDGLGYDIRSFTPEGRVKYIEVKTTRGSANAHFFITPNELKFAEENSESFSLYRVYDYDEDNNYGKLRVRNGEDMKLLNLTPTQYRTSIQ